MKLRFPFLFAALGAWLALVPVGALHAQAAPAPDNNDKTDSVQAAPAAAPVDAPAPAPAAPTPTTAPEPAPVPAQVAPPAPPPASVWIDRGQVTVFGDNVTIREDERASEVTAYGGNVTVLGRVEGKVVAWGGNVKLEGFAGSVTAVGGNLKLGPKAQVAGAVALVGGRVDNPHRVPLRNNPLELAHHLPAPPDILPWLGDTLLHPRLLSPHVAWPWYAFGACLLFYLLLAAIFRNGVNACAQSLEERPGSTLATALALPLLILLLICTVIGIVLLPFLAVALLFAGVFGKVAVLAFLGRSLLRAFGLGESVGQAWLTVLIGAVLMAVLYCVPWLGLLIWALTLWIGLGMVVATILEKRRREKAAAAAAKPVPAVYTSAPVAAPAMSPAAAPFAPVAAPMPANVLPVPVVAAPVVAPDLMDATAAAAAPIGAAVPPAMPQPSVPPPPPLVAPVPPALAEATLPRAEFGVRLAALLIDIVLVGAIGGVSLAFALLPFPLFFGGYVFAFWLWRGTTIGGIVLNLKVVRLDGRPVDAATAAVRTLAAFLSVAAVGLGFLWCLWDDERQTWHDKVAGTVVVRVPKATPLV